MFGFGFGFENFARTLIVGGGTEVSDPNLINVCFVGSYATFASNRNQGGMKE